MKPENRFIQRIHQHIGELYAEKMANPWRGGTPDVWYSGGSDLWVEYKWLPRVPVTADVAVAEDLLSPLQRRWLLGRAAEGRSVAVIVGCPDGGVVFPGTSWMTPVTASQFRSRLVSVRDLATYLLKSTHAFDKVSKHSRRGS